MEQAARGRMRLRRPRCRVERTRRSKESGRIGLPYIAFEGCIQEPLDEFVVLQDVNFFVNAGETLCILGRSGVGKSVSLQMLLGFLKPDSGGEIRVAGEDIIVGLTERELQAIRRKVTMVFQNGALFDSITVGENVAFASAGTRGELAEEQIYAEL